MLPASACVMANADRTTSGEGLIANKFDAHFELSGSICAESFGLSMFGARRENVWTVLVVSMARSDERMNWPEWPVPPNTAALVNAIVRYILKIKQLFVFNFPLNTIGVD